VITVVVMCVRGCVIVHGRRRRQSVVRRRAADHRRRGKALQGQCQQQHDGQQEAGRGTHEN
jgi:hypothetical protein